MALPPKGDPRRELALAIRTAWVLTGLMIAIFLLFTVALGFASFKAGGGVPTLALGLVIGVITLELLCLLIPTIFLTRRKKWAAIVLIVVASLGALSGLVNVIGGLITGQASLAIFGLAMALALGQFINYLSKSFRGIDYEIMMNNSNWTGGFEPIMAPGVPPPVNQSLMQTPPPPPPPPPPPNFR